MWSIILCPGKNIKMKGSDGIIHDITFRVVLATLAIGWAAFGLSLLFNLLYYALHPSQVRTKCSGMFDKHDLHLPLGELGTWNLERKAGGGDVWL